MMLSEQKGIPRFKQKGWIKQHLANSRVNHKQNVIDQERTPVWQESQILRQHTVPEMIRNELLSIGSQNPEQSKQKQESAGTNSCLTQGCERAEDQTIRNEFLSNGQNYSPPYTPARLFRLLSSLLSLAFNYQRLEPRRLKQKGTD